MLSKLAELQISEAVEEEDDSSEEEDTSEEEEEEDDLSPSARNSSNLTIITMQLFTISLFVVLGSAQSCLRSPPGGGVIREFIIDIALLTYSADGTVSSKRPPTTPTTPTTSTTSCMGPPNSPAVH
uniref:Uncharacterized protein n=1 Tax=Steinernema glaseri TaxID=37863 RepID=A0A1I7Y856_9BILA